MAFLDKMKEVGVRGLNSAKDLGDTAKLNIQKEKALVKIKDTCSDVGRELLEKYPDVFAQYFPDAYKTIMDCEKEIENIEAMKEEIKNN